MTVHARQSLVTALALAVSLLVLAPAAVANGGHDHADRSDKAAEAGHDHGSADHGHPHRADFAAGRPGEPGEVDRTIRIAAEDIDFSEERIEVDAGETVRFVITNTGELVHDFTIGTVEAQADHREEMAEMLAQKPDPASLITAHHHAGANAVMLAPGETKELIWIFEQASDVEFACNVPGHYEAGMHGEIGVRALKAGEGV